MFIFKLPKINRITAIYFITLFFLYRFVSLPDIFFIIAIFCYVIIPAYGSIKICSNFYVDAVCSILDKTAVVLTFNLANSEIDPTKLLKLLGESGVKVMFFVTRQYVEVNPEWVKMIHERGHILGNHYFYNSKKFGFDRPSELVLNLDETSKMISNITKDVVVFFRPPFGITNPFVKKAIKRLDLSVIGWQIKVTQKKLEKERSIDKIIRKIKGGEIILVDLSDSVGFENIHTFIKELSQRNISFRLLD